MVTRLAWIAHRFMSSMSLTNQASIASWIANNTVAWKQRSTLKSCAASLTSLATHNFLHNNSVLFWYLLICWSATVPGRYLQGFLMVLVNPCSQTSSWVTWWATASVEPFQQSFVSDRNPWLSSYSFCHHHQMMVVSWWYSAIKGENRKKCVKKSCKEDEWCELYRFYHKFKHNKFFIGHDVMYQGIWHSIIRICHVMMNSILYPLSTLIWNAITLSS